jgi:hypothetical protein
MSALTTTVSPSTAFGGCCGSGVRGRMSSITMRPSTHLAYQRARAPETPGTVAQQMKALRSFTVRPRLPERLQRLETLAMNLRWSWDERTRDLFRWVDPDGWEESRHDPVRVIGHVSRERLAEPSMADVTEHAHRVVTALLPAVGIEPAEQVARSVVPRPPKVHGQLLEPGQRLGETGSNGEAAQCLHLRTTVDQGFTTAGRLVTKSGAGSHRDRRHPPAHSGSAASTEGS